MIHYRATSLVVSTSIVRNAPDACQEHQTKFDPILSSSPSSSSYSESVSTSGQESKKKKRKSKKKKRG